MKRGLKSITLFICTFILVGSLEATTILAEGIVTLNNFDLVDGGKHLDWDGGSNYKEVFKVAVQVYNEYKSGVVRPDRWNTLEDVTIGDYYTVNAVNAYTSSKGYIRFNQYNMDQQTDAQNRQTALKVLGYALGLGATSNKIDVMYKYTSTASSLSGNDKASYDAAYKEY